MDQDPNDQNKKIKVPLTDTTSVPTGIKLILDAIRAAQFAVNNPRNQTEDEKQKIYNDAFVEIKRIAKERLDHPRFSLWKFKVRSDITTKFYEDILKYDPENKIKASVVPDRSNALDRK